MFKRLLPSIILALGLIGAAYAVNITGTNSANENSVLKIGYERLSVSDSIAAFAGGGQTSATLLDSAYNRVITVASAADSVKLPLCQSGASNTAQLAPGVISGNTTGLLVWVTNATATNALAVFPQTGQTIINTSANTSFSIPALKTASFICAANGAWWVNLSA